MLPIKVRNLSVRNVAISPSRSAANVFVDNFTDCLIGMGFSVSEFEWKPLPKARTVIFHWPNEFFTNAGFAHAAKCATKLAVMRIWRVCFGVRFVWVAHNVQPHDIQKKATWLRNIFLSSLDGVIFLSQFSSDALRRAYPLPAGMKTLQTVHGDYRGNMIVPPRPQEAVAATARLVAFGQIRAYKNFDKLVETVVGMSDSGIHLTVVGQTQDADLASKIRTVAAGSGDVSLDIRSEFLPRRRSRTVSRCCTWGCLALPQHSKQWLSVFGAVTQSARSRPTHGQFARN